MSKLISTAKCVTDLLREHRSRLQENSAQFPCWSVRRCACVSGRHGNVEAQAWSLIHLRHPGHAINSILHVHQQRHISCLVHISWHFQPPSPPPVTR